MRIDVISAASELLESPFNHSILKRAKEKGLFEVVVHNLREYGLGPHRKIDDYAFGGGAGMVMMIEPIEKCIEALQAEREYDEIIYMAPDGVLFSQALANRLSLKKNLLILCGHYKGVDERVRERLITLEISVGDFVLSGGELPAALVVDSIGRLIPGALSDETSALLDSFQDGLIAPPVYTRPADYKGWKIPEVLLSGHEEKIEEWRLNASIQRTKERRPDLLEE